MASPSPETWSASVIELLDRLCAAHAWSWKVGQPPSVEAALEQAPEEARVELFRRLLDLERAHRQRLGEPFPAAEARERFAPLGRWALDVVDEEFGDGPTFTLTLEVVGGPRAGQSFTFTEHTRFLVGRLPGLQLSVPEDRVLSKVHCVIEFNPPLCRVEDNASTNSTFVNRVKVEQPVPLRDGDEVSAGQNVIRVGLTATDDPGTWSGDDATAGSLVTPPAGPAVPGYTVERELGRGGMGVVYLARAGEGQPVALKTVLPAMMPTALTLGRFRREVEVLKRLVHPHIVRFLDAGSAGGVLWFAMEYVEGESAARLIEKSGPLPLRRGLDLGLQLLDALAFAHSHGFVHRDVKPGNVLLQGERGRETLKLADFGLARAYEASAMSGLTVSGTSGGTPGFMPPEQVMDFRAARPAADQYAAAATIYTLLTGRPIYEPKRSQMAYLQQILVEEPLPLRSPPADLPAAVVGALNRALARDPEKRHPDVAALRASLEKAV